MKKITYKLIAFCSISIIAVTANNLFAQNVLITDDSTYVAKPSAILDVKSDTKGVLIPRVSLTSTSSPLPITSPDSSLMVYNIATTADVIPGYYYWNGNKWVDIATGQGLHNVTKTSSATLLKSETMVLASNDITLTLPAITASDDGLDITIKNVGSCTDLITVVPSSGFIDGNPQSVLSRWKGKSYVAAGGNWIVKQKETRTDNLFDISTYGSWTTIDEMVAFLNKHMTAPTVVRLNGNTYTISATEIINLPYPVTFEGLSFGEAEIDATAGLTGSPMFDCQTECYFKMLKFKAYTNTTGSDALHFSASGTYHEVKDCDFNGFSKGIVFSNNNSSWIFENNFENCSAAAVEISAGTASGGEMEMSENDFTQCGIGVNLLSAVSETVAITNCDFYNTVPGTIGILYTPATFTSYTTVLISNNTWDNNGDFIDGFDFTRPDGRDANASLEANIGVGDSKPGGIINVMGNDSVTNIPVAYTWEKAQWTNTSSSTCKLTVNDNRFTYQPLNSRNGFIIITGQLAAYSNVISIGLVKNGNTDTIYGQTNVYISSSSEPFTTFMYINGIQQNDYFELYCTSNYGGDMITIENLQWIVDCR